MINPIILEQLKQVKVADLPAYSDTDTVIHIPKQESDIPIVVGRCYMIELDNYLLNPPPDFNLHINWNKNIIPKDKYMNCQVLQIQGKMLKISAVGVDKNTQIINNQIWEGWLPRKSIKIMKEL